MKEVLIITYYWKSTDGPGIQRWLRFTKYLRDSSVESMIYTPENPIYPFTDEAIADDLPTDLQVIKQPIRKPYSLTSLSSEKETQKTSAGVILRKKVSVLEKLTP